MTKKHRKKGSGGKRPGSGRKNVGNVVLQLRVQPQFIPAIREFVEGLKKNLINPPPPLSPAACSTGRS